ncbi:hypothetical protein NLJ89_g10579 [Agrocybe chaxingu]|uniref:Uncharacterized protein n=1 Tax=Agrocybe chaxingu TaxID=84603 RepID=A0A9W8JR02_9AGAR|nr:hypothetical protein NLJ89_g10579 [Agrocybe chaxingu]
MPGTHRPIRAMICRKCHFWNVANDRRRQCLHQQLATRSVRKVAAAEVVEDPADAFFGTWFLRRRQRENLREYNCQTYRLLPSYSARAISASNDGDDQASAFSSSRRAYQLTCVLGFAAPRVFTPHGYTLRHMSFEQGAASEDRIDGSALRSLRNLTIHLLFLEGDSEDLEYIETKDSFPWLITFLSMLATPAHPLTELNLHLCYGFFTLEYIEDEHFDSWKTFAEFLLDHFPNLRKQEKAIQELWHKERMDTALLVGTPNNYRVIHPIAPDPTWVI